MNVSSIPFLVALLLASAFFFHLPGGNLRRFAFALANALAIYLLLPNLASLALLAIFLLSGYVAARWLMRRPSRAGLALYLAVLVAAFAYLKRYEFLGLLLPDSLLNHPVRIVGLSYMLFRQIHFIVDAMQGQIGNTSVWAYLNYQLNLFALLAGPIQRFETFSTYWDEPRPLLRERHELMKTLLRVFLGVLKIALVAAPCLTLYEKLAAGFDAPEAALRMGRGQAVLDFARMLYLYPAYAYFNFSGYCDIVIGGAALVGLRLPENFNRPWLARNMIDFWTRWHRTLSFWVRDYIFTPTYMGIVRRWPRRAPSLAFLCYFMALLLAGVWHGSTWNFVVFGLCHGAGVSAAKIWETFLIARLGRAGWRRYMASRRVRIAARLLTFHFVCFTLFMFVPTDIARCARIVANFFTVLL